MIVIGSTAMAQLGFLVTPNDLDLVGTYEEAVEFRKKFKATSFYPINSGKCFFMQNAEGQICEIEIAWPDSRAEKFIKWMGEDAYFQWKWCDIVEIHGTSCHVPSLDVLYMLKMSHRYLKDSPHFLKTMNDIWWMRTLNAKIPEHYRAFYKERMKDTYAYAHPKLNVSKEGFFDAVGTGVPYIYDHDSIHEAVKKLDKPAYAYFKPDDSEVAVSREMFDALPHLFKLYSVAEEAYVLAIERSLVPYPGGKTHKEAFDFALMKVCTSITSGWFREFSWEHYSQVQDTYDALYYHKFEKGLETGVVKPFKG